MPDRIQKFLRKLTEKQRRWIGRLIERIVAGKIDDLDVKKLQGIQNVYRIRKGDIRIVYRMLEDEVFIIAIERRSDATSHTNILTSEIAVSVRPYPCDNLNHCALQRTVV